MIVSNEGNNEIQIQKDSKIWKGCDIFATYLPIFEWLPKYKKEYIIQDIIAGVTVGLTAIAQGIAYATIAGLPPEYGLYGSLTAGLIYMLFGRCVSLTIGPTAILSAVLTKYVSGYSPDFAILLTFLSGVFMLVTGLLNLGFLVQFLSTPVTKGFTIGAVLQIGTSQLKAIFGTKGLAGNIFSESVYNFFCNIKTVRLWDPVLGIATILLLVLLKKLGNNCEQSENFVKKIRWYLSISRNAVVVFLGMIIAYTIKFWFDTEPLILVGEIGSGLPVFRLPAFSTMVGNQTYDFTDMLSALGPQAIVVPFVSILEVVVIAKAFSKDGQIDAKQEIIAVSLCNIIGAFGQSMPITGSFTRTALNHISGVKSPAGGIFTVLLVVIALKTLTAVFYYIPKASLGALIVTALISLIDFKIFIRLWKNDISDFFVLLITIVLCMFLGLEYGIIVGVIIDALILLYHASRPKLSYDIVSIEKNSVMVIPLSENLSYCAAEHVRYKIMNLVFKVNEGLPVILDGSNLKRIDSTSISNLISIAKDLDKKYRLRLLNFDSLIKDKCLIIEPELENKFIYTSYPIQLLVL